MRRGITLFAGIMAFVGLGWVAAHAPLPVAGMGGAAPRMESTLQAAAEDALQMRGLEWADVRMDGQIAVLSGVAPREEERVEAREVVLASYGDGGLWSGGVTRVEDLTSLAPPVSPYEWRAVRDDARVVLSGVAPSRAMRDELVAYADALFEGRTDNTMAVARGALDEAAWLATARTALAQLASLEDGQAYLKDARLRLEGDAPDAETRTRVVSAVAKLPGPFMAVARVRAPESAVDAAVADADEEAGSRSDIIDDPQLCQGVLDALMAEDAIAFASGRSVIDKESYPLLDRLARAATRCRGVPLRVEGHTDSSGDPGANERLSKSRAQAVADYLILKGVPTEQLSPEGYGDTRPVADNDTEEGRARNRRIEIHVVN